MRDALGLICYLRVGPGFWGEIWLGGGKGGKIGESLKKLEEAEILFSPRVCDQVAALTEGLSTDYALVWLFTLMQIFS